MKTIEKSNINIEDIKKQITDNIGKKIKIQESNKNGKKVKEYFGEIINSYASLFIVKVEIRGNYLNKSFSYIDFLTNELIFEIL